MDAAGMGLKIMRYRARILGGEVSFEGSRASRTRIVCECPFEAARGSNYAHSAGAFPDRRSGRMNSLFSWR